MLLTMFFLLAGLSSAAGVYRLLIGPSRADRVIGLDLLFAIAVIFCLLAAWQSMSVVYLDVAIGLVLTGFVATLSWAKLVQQKRTADQAGL